MGKFCAGNILIKIRREGTSNRVIIGPVFFFGFFFFWQKGDEMIDS